MGALVTRRVHRRQPHGAAQIDRGNPLGARVVECLPLNGQPYATVSGAKLTLTNGVINAVKDRALALRSNGTSACGSVPIDLSAYSKVTIAFWLYWDSYATETLAMELGSTYSAVPGFIVDPGCQSPAAFMFGVGNVGGSNLVTFPRPSAATWHRILLTLDRSAPAGTSGTAYVDGVAQTMSPFSGSSATSGNFASDTLHLFSRNESSVFGAGSMEMLTIYGGILSAGEAQADFENCYQVLKSPGRRLWVVSASASSATTINAGEATATISGIAAQVAAATTIAANEASVGDAGLAATITLPTSVSASEATATDTGLAASIALPTGIAAGEASEVASGLAAGVVLPTTISASEAVATDSGLAASVTTGAGIQASTATESASGLTASVSLPTTIAASKAQVLAAGLNASTSSSTVISAGQASATDVGLGATVDQTAVVGPPIAPNPSRTYVGQPRVRMYVAQKRVREL